MSTRSNVPSGTFRHISDAEFDAATGALQVGHREIVATMVGLPAPIRLLSWAIGFDGRSGAAVRYQDIKTILGTVGGMVLPPSTSPASKETSSDR